MSLRRPTGIACLIMYLLCLSSARVEAQTGNIAGTVTDAESSRPVIDARVFVPDTPLSAYTDAEGRYALNAVAVGEVEIRIERTGYAPGGRTLIVSVGQTVTADFNLTVSAVAVDALVVTATGLQRRRELGNGAATVDVDVELRRAAPRNLTSLLQGRATGVQVLQASGSVGTSASLKIRGNGSISVGDTPILYVDGARVSNDLQSGPGVGGQTTSRLNDLTLDDIESIEIVKGPSAATLYGAEAAAGVIRITTKRGRAGITEWTVRSEVGANWDATAWPETVWNPRSFLGEVYDVAELFDPGQLPPGQFFASIPDTLYTLNLLAGQEGYDAPWRTGLEQSYGVSLRGGSANVTYFLSGDFSDQSGTLSNNEALRRGLRANFNILPSQNVDVALSASYTNSRVLLPDNDNSTFGYIGVALVGVPWGRPIRRNDLGMGGEFATCPIAFEIQRAVVNAGVAPPSLSELTEANCPENPFFSERTFDDIATLVNAQDVERITMSSSVDYRPLAFLGARATVGYDQFADQTGYLVPVDADLPFGDASRGQRGISHTLDRQLTIDAIVNAGYHLVSDLRATTSAGLQFYRRKLEATGASGLFLPLGSQIVSGAVRTDGFESVGERRTLGFFVQQQFEFRDRLFVTPSVRFDDSSAFGANLGREAYPRVMASYVISEEAWFERTMPGWLVESLRLRAAWGESGNPPGNFAALKLLGPRRVTFNGEDVSGVSLTGPGNPDLKPQRSQEVELGFEADLLGGRVGLDFTWYRAKTKNVIVPRPIAPSTGYSAGAFANIGEMTNTGIEVGVSGLVVNREDLVWDWLLNLSTTKGEITEMEDPIIFGLGGDSQRHQKGYPFGSYFSRVYQVGPGGGVTASDSAVYVGQPTPQVEGSLSTSLQVWSWLTLHASLGFAGGHQQFNSTEEFRCGFLGGGTYGGLCPALFERGANGERTTAARVKAEASSDLEYAPWIEDADFARLRTVSASVRLPQSWLQRVGATDGSFTLTGENVALFTKYSGLDPEVNFAGGAQGLRAEFFTLPPAKRLTGRFVLSF